MVRRDAWEMAKKYPQDQREGQSHIEKFSTNILERYFVVDSGASMHMLNRKDLNPAKTFRVSRNFTPVFTANGEAQTNEEATVYVYDLASFVTMQIEEDTPAVLPIGKLCEDYGSSCEWISGR